MRTLLREEKLVDDDIMRIDLVLRQLLNQPLGLVQGKELGDADTDECRLFLSDVSRSTSLRKRGGRRGLLGP